MTKPTIYLDMDGVLVDFVNGAIEATGIDLTHDTWTEWDAYRLKGWTSDQFWAPINERLYFWEDLQPYPWAEELLELCKSFGEVVFCSTPSRNPESASGKLTWLRQRGWLKDHDCILMKDKWRLAKPGTILIDDRRESCALFAANGGRDICFPQPWNRDWWSAVAVATHPRQVDRLKYTYLMLNHFTLGNF
jgi:5'(3')-deoxyribonucleotidase